MNYAGEENRIRGDGYAQCFGENIAFIKKARENEQRDRQEASADDKYN